MASHQDSEAHEPASEPKPKPEPLPFSRFQSRRSVVYGTRGVVACTNPLAAQAGLKILEAGGNAADAAVAVAAVLNVVDPSMTGIGGDVFALYYDAATGAVRGLNGSGRSPLAATRAAVCRSVGVPVIDDGGGPGTGRIDEERAAATSLPRSSIHAMTVPAGAAGWVDAVEQFGSGNVTLAQILDPAVRLAENGFAVSRLSAYYWALAEDELRTKSPGNAGRDLLKADTTTQGADVVWRAPREGEIFRCPPLAATLRRLGEYGKNGFYAGPVAQAIVEVARAKGGLLSLEDLRHHASLPPDIHEAMSLPLRIKAAPGVVPASSSNNQKTVRLWEHPPNGQGIVALLAMGILNELERTGKIPPLASMAHNSAPYLHAVISALRIAFADAGWWVADPQQDKHKDEKHNNQLFDPQRLLHPAYLAERALLFDPDRALNHVPETRGYPQADDRQTDEADLDHLQSETLTALHTSDTVYLAVTDEAGNGCSFVNSMADLFGARLVPQGTGFALANRGHMFRLGPADHPNVFAGGKRAYNTIIPAILTEDVEDNTNTRTDSPTAGDHDAPQPPKQQHRLAAVFGVMGGFMQPQGHVQVLLNMHAFGMDPQTAVDAPRVCVGTNVFWTPDPAAQVHEGHVYAEEGLPDDAVAGLRALGYTVQWLRGYARSLFGRGQVIRADRDPVTGERVYAAGSDGRGDGHAVPL
ncbi:gamma-glutamyltranspeptidase [Niveomyces insectorum RCEF 264]|uniref:Gamma-glutamyltranspeptidase n=1 Tax=Niveomyces insectorum RCEF 264 TaxID=1081102 RepID=A0A167PF11_9HYPO|nr:gamma-glutamyltranspeptidase [Niveomyces insectorum RCEF 264]